MVADLFFEWSLPTLVGPDQKPRRDFCIADQIKICRL